MFERLRLVGGSALAFSLLVSLAVRFAEPPKAGAAAQIPRQVRLPISTKIEPVVVTKVTLGSVAVQSARFAKPAGETAAPVTLFVADDNWIQDLSVYFLNRTNRAIVFAALRFSFPETTVGRIRYSFPLTLGRIPPSESFNLDGTPFRSAAGRGPLSFGPHQTIAIHLDDYIDGIKARIERAMPLAALTAMNVTVGQIFFDGGMEWNAGYQIFDPKNSAWRRAAPGYFPGDMDAYWPGRPGWIDQQ